MHTRMHIHITHGQCLTTAHLLEVQYILHPSKALAQQLAVGWQCDAARLGGIAKVAASVGQHHQHVWAQGVGVAVFCHSLIPLCDVPQLAACAQPEGRGGPHHISQSNMPKKPAPSTLLLLSPAGSARPGRSVHQHQLRRHSPRNSSQQETEMFRTYLLSVPIMRYRSDWVS